MVEPFDGVKAPLEETLSASSCLGISLDLLLNQIEATKFDPSKPPPVEPCVLKLAGVEIAHAGNLVTVAAAIKSGKSSVIAAMMASTMGEMNRDYLGFEGNNPDLKTILHFDSEQSKGDHYAMMMRMLRRAEITNAPSCFQSFPLLSQTPHERRIAVLAMARKAFIKRGLLAVFIDGVADLVEDVNDQVETSRLVFELHKLASETRCVIVVALHHNPGTEKSRGHLGSQLERKSESVILLRKKDQVTTIYCRPARHAEVAEDVAPCFKWEDEADMHVSAQSKLLSLAERRHLELTELADEVFGGKTSLRWVDLQSSIKSLRNWSATNADNKIKAMIKLQIIGKNSLGIYVKLLTNPTPHSTPV